ncbi:MAG: prepilin-type N-terminal cleavage/methylation domain-containing protein [Acidobacteria bacterium]|nr:prepilin-type N-terminal cleavage/methylation domain-containing protein [Acidobacteriota bacterium]
MDGDAGMGGDRRVFGGRGSSGSGVRPRRRSTGRGGRAAMTSTRESSGFTLAELLVALVLSAIVVSAVAALTATTDRFARSQSRVMDAQQRARVIAETLGRDLRLAGAGLDRGPMSGPLNRVFTPLWPRRVGRVRPDAPTVVRPDALTLAWVPDTIIQTTLANGDVPSLGRILLVPCAGGALPCRVARGATLAVFDAPGRCAARVASRRRLGGGSLAHPDRPKRGPQLLRCHVRDDSGHPKADRQHEVQSALRHFFVALNSVQGIRCL